jgi:hypothetical protein
MTLDMIREVEVAREQAMETHDSPANQTVKAPSSKAERSPVARSQEVEVSGPGSQRRSFQHALGRKQSGDPVLDADSLLNEIFALAMRPFVVLLCGARRPDHAADLAISGERSRQDTQKALSIEAIGLRPPCAPCDENARRLNDVTDDAVVSEKSMQPKPVAASFETTSYGHIGAHPGRNLLP